jgi:hypothetical protein
MELAIIESRNRLNDDEEVGKPASLFFNVGLISAVRFSLPAVRQQCENISGVSVANAAF